MHERQRTRTNKADDIAYAGEEIFSGAPRNITRTGTTHFSTTSPQISLI